MVLLEVVLQVTVEVAVTVVAVQDFLEMVPHLLEPHQVNEQDLTPVDQGVVMVQTVGAVKTGAVSAVAAVVVLLEAAVAVTLAAAVEIGHLT
tara:strand:- start:144 stop:419 length:276 start_codon:yes stop_codon:yes gene_type:complete